MDRFLNISNTLLKRNYLCLCGPRCKDVVTGVSLAFELLIEGLYENETKYITIDSTLGAKIKRSGSFSFLRAFSSLLVIILVAICLPFSNRYYCIISTSYLGFIKDYITVNIAYILNCRIVLHLHGGGFHEFYSESNPVLKFFIKSYIQRVDKIIVLGELLKDQFYCLGDFVNQKLVSVPNGLTYGIKEPRHILKSLPNKEPIQLLYLSNLMPSKGFMDVIMAVQLLNNSYPNKYHLNLCGEFVNTITEPSSQIQNKEQLYMYLNQHDLSNIVSYRGQVLGKLKEEYLRDAHVFILPTYYSWEGQPLSIIEAMSYSTPVVSCHHKGIPELIEENISGIFVKPCSPYSIKNAIMQIIKNEKNYTSMSKNSRDLYKRKFTREIHIKNMLNIIL